MEIGTPLPFFSNAFTTLERQKHIENVKENEDN